MREESPPPNTDQLRSEPTLIEDDDSSANPRECRRLSIAFTPDHTGMNDTLELFQYNALEIEGDGIRLLQLNTRNGRVECSLETFDLNDCPKYDAVSYAWGPKSPGKVIVVNGGTLSVSENLWSFLKNVDSITWSQNSLLPISRARYLWVDQICIDQSTIREKNHQVQQMGDIFSSAEQVLVWLGSGMGEEKGVLRILSGLREVSKAVPGPDEEPALKNPDLIPAEREAFDILFSQTYWSRLWVVQEILVAKAAILCFGAHFMHVEELTDFHVVRIGSDVRAFTDHPLERRPWISILLYRLLPTLGADQYTPEQTRMTLLSILGSFASMDCENPRDKIYGLLAIVPEEQQ